MVLNILFENRFVWILECLLDFCEFILILNTKVSKNNNFLENLMQKIE